MAKSTLIILTRNEIVGLRALITKIPFASVDEYFAVDYQSTDGTQAFLDKHNIPIVQQEKPGIGEAFQLGVKKASGTYLIFFSPDGNDNPADIPRLLQELKRGADYTIASRLTKSSQNEEDRKLLGLRKATSRTLTLLVNIFFRQTFPWQENYITDTISGYRAIRKDAFYSLALDAQGFDIMYQMSIRAFKKRLKITEIQTNAGKRIGGTPGSRALPTGIRFITCLVREIAIGNNFSGQKR